MTSTAGGASDTATKAIRKSSKVTVAVPEMRRPVSGMRSMEELQVTDADRPQPLAEVQELLQQSLSDSKEKHGALCSLAAVVAKCRRCNELATTRKQTVFGVGSARVCVVDAGVIGDPRVHECLRYANPLVYPGGVVQETRGTGAHLIFATLEDAGATYVEIFLARDH